MAPASRAAVTGRGRMTPDRWLKRHLAACLILAPVTALVVIGINSGWW